MIDLLHGDCMVKMQSMLNDSVDFTLTDIPYNVVNRKDNGLRTLDKGNADVLTFDLESFLDVVASRGRNPENPSDRTTGAPTEQRFEPNFSGTTNCLTSVAKDNYICEPVIIEDFYKSREARIYSETAPTLRSERIGLEVAEEFPCSTRGKQVASAIRASIYKQGVRNIEENIINGLGYEGVVEKEQPITRWRIRKLTPVECWRLMGFTDEDYNRAAQYVSASARYKQAGNSIVVNTLVSLFSSLLVDNGYKSEIWTKYITDFTDKSH